MNPGRKSLPHLPAIDFSNRSTVIYISQNVKFRRRLLARPEIHELLRTCWADADHWMVGRYVLMPDHLHLFCAPLAEPRTPLKNWVEYWRSLATRRWPYTNEKPIWQKDFFDRQLRSGDSYSQKWLYLWENPIASGLVKEPSDWSFQGELNVLQWAEPVH